jgi:hypothetical protein
VTGDTDIEGQLADPAVGSALTLAYRPPRWLFHGLLALATLPVLWATSLPGSSTGWLLLSFVTWTAFGVTWLVRLILYMTHRRRLSWWFVVAPLMFVTLVWVVVADLPLKVRWAASQTAFDTAVAELPPGQEVGTEPQTIGSFRISYWERVPQGVLFYESHGSFMFNDAGFAYLPDGPSDAMESGTLESPEFRSLGGPWYAWTASW